MASLAAAARDIPQSSPGRDNFTVVAAENDRGTVTRSQTLPTPPNSISPALPAHGLKAQLQKAKLDAIDSDLDLQAGPGPHDRSVSPHLDSSGAITSTMLAKLHLPEILLNHGPLAIRHIMGYLTTSVPGFSGIPPTKARRLVVGALEGRGGEGGSVDGEVEFEKVGWGRWDARRHGSGPRCSLSTSGDSHGIPITGGTGKAAERGRPSRASPGFDGVHFSHDGHDMSMMDDDAADNMSMDGSASASCSEAPDDDDVAMGDDPEDATDDEDWAAVGAAALRAESYPTMEAAMLDREKNGNGWLSSCGLRSFSASGGMARTPQATFDLSVLAEASGAQEREAVEALLRLGSV